MLECLLQLCALMGFASLCITGIHEQALNHLPSSFFSIMKDYFCKTSLKYFSATSVRSISSTGCMLKLKKPLGSGCVFWLREAAFVTLVCILTLFPVLLSSSISWKNWILLSFFISEFIKVQMSTTETAITCSVVHWEPLSTPSREGKRLLCDYLTHSYLYKGQNWTQALCPSTMAIARHKCQFQWLDQQHFPYQLRKCWERWRSHRLQYFSELHISDMSEETSLLGAFTVQYLNRRKIINALCSTNNLNIATGQSGSYPAEVRTVCPWLLGCGTTVILGFSFALSSKKTKPQMHWGTKCMNRTWYNIHKHAFSNKNIYYHVYSAYFTA